MKLLKHFLPFLLITILITGCGTAEKANNTEDSPSKHESTEQNQNQNNNEESVQTSRSLEQQLPISSIEGNKEKIAYLKESDNQQYSMYVLPEYELTAEEPGKDSLMLKEKEQTFMRIEILSNSNIENESKTINAQLSTVSQDIQTNENINDLPNATRMTASNEKHIVSAYLIPNGSKLIKLTIFTTPGDKQEDIFLEMGKTIEISNK